MKIFNFDQYDEAYWRKRNGKPTTSSFSNLITSKGTPSTSIDKYALSLAGDLYAGKQISDFKGSQATERGHELEGAARAKYAMLNNVDVVEVGFVTDDAETYGCSPDGLVGDDGLIEIKCLTKIKHIEAIIYYNKNKHMQTTYVQQTQGQMFVCEREWCDLVFYHPDLPMMTIRSEPDTKIIHALKPQLELVIDERDEILGMLRSMAA